MSAFFIGILILVFGYIFYSTYTEKQFGADDNIQTPAVRINDGIDFVPLSKRKNMLIQLLNIAGLGPILGAIQGILFGPVAFILIPLGAVFMGSVHDYFAGMLSVRNNGAQITEITRKYLGKIPYGFMIGVVGLMLIIIAAVFVYTAGDLIAERFFHQTDFSLTNHVVILIYVFIAAYYIIATLFPIDKIIGRFYPLFALLLLIGTALVLIGFFVSGLNLEPLDFNHINRHPNHLPIVPMFFMTVSCGLLSGFHSTQATIISRTITKESEGRRVFFGMMCVESLIAMIWAAGAMHVYSLNLVPSGMVGTANVINSIADTFVMPILAFIVTIAIVVLPITTGDTALRGFRMIAAEVLKLDQRKVINRLLIMLPVVIAITGIIFWVKTDEGSFSTIWRYFNFVNQLLTIPVFLCATVYLYHLKKNYLMTLLPGLFYVFVTAYFILNSKIGFNLSYKCSSALAVLPVIICLILMFKLKLKNEKIS